MEKLKCRVGINRRQLKDSTHEIVIQIDDVKSNLRAVEIYMTATEFAHAVTGLYSEGEMEFNQTGMIGSTYEHKTVEIPVGKELKYQNKNNPGIQLILSKLLEPYEVEGWKADRDEAFNQYRYTDKGINFTFRRYVKSA